MREIRRACGKCLGSGTEAYGYPGKDGPWDVPTCRKCGGCGVFPPHRVSLQGKTPIRAT